MDNNIGIEILKLVTDAKPLITIDPKRAYEILKSAYTLALANDLKSEQGYCLINIGLTYRSTSSITNWIDCAHKSLYIFQDLDEKSGIVSSLNLLGSAYFHAGLYEDSLSYYLKCLDLCLSESFNYIHSCVLNNIGEIYRTTLEYSKAIEYYNQSIIFSKKYKYDDILASVLLNIGQVLLNENNYSSALSKFQLSYDMTLKLNNNILLGEIETKLGELYYKTNDYTKAMYHYGKALNHLDRVENKYYTIDLLINIGLLKLEDHPEFGIKFFNQAIDCAKDMNLKNKLSKAYLLLSDYYEKTFDYKTALYYHKQYHEIEDKISASVIRTKLEILKIQCENSLEDEKLEHIKIINQRLEVEISSQNKKLEYMKKENKTLKYKALKDCLTDIPNRHAITSHLDNLWEYSNLTIEPMVFFVIDIDNFKMYNDYWGHIQGDNCLKDVANCLSDVQSMRNDFCGRYGGEEFVYMAQNLTYEEAINLGNMLREKVQHLNIKYNSNINSIPLTISLGGVYGTLKNFRSKANMIDLADKQLYLCKNAGRNRVSITNIMRNTCDENTLIEASISLVD